MFRRYPYPGWLILSILLWGAAIVQFYIKTQEVKPAKMAKAIQKNLQAKEEDLDNLLNDNGFLNRLFAEQPTDEDIQRLSDLPYYIYGYDRRGLIFWNTNELLTDCNHLSTSEKLEKNDRGSFIKRCISLSRFDSSKKITVLFPIVYKYPFENNYLVSHFEAQSYIPVTTDIAAQRLLNSYEIKNISGKTLFYVSFPRETTEWAPGKTLLWSIVAALLATIAWLQLITIYLTRKRKPVIGFAITIASIVVLRSLTYLYGLPFNLNDLPIFSPQLYASSNFLPSLGDLLLNALCFLWLVVFTIRHLPPDALGSLKLNRYIRALIALLLILLLIGCASFYINVTQSLVLDSMISFDVSHFYSITSYTLIGLFTIGIITSVSCLMIYLFNRQLSWLVKNKWVKYMLVFIIGLLTIFIYNNYKITSGLPFILLGCLVVFIILLDIKRLASINDIFAPQTIFWSVLVCAFCTVILLYFYNIKERETRKRYAEQVLQQRDDVTEFAFRNISQNIQKDRSVKQFLRRPSPDLRRTLNERFDALYISGQLNKYQSRILMFDNRGTGLYNSDTIGFTTLVMELHNAEPTSDSTLYYKDYAQDGHYYLANIPVFDDSTGNKLGNVFIDLGIKESAGETVYPELLQPGSIKVSQNEANYSYGIYVNNRLLTQSGEYSFPANLSNDNKPGQHIFTSWDASSELLYSTDGYRTVKVIRFYKLWLDSITLFSYLFGIQILIVLFIVLYRLSLSYFIGPRYSVKLINLTLRNRIHFSMLGVVLVSFLVIGLVTTGYFTIQYKQNSRKKQQRTMQAVERSVLQFLKQEKGLTNNRTFNETTGTAKFKYFITSLANAQKIDINVFNGSGILNVASQESIYDKILLARIIRPDAYYLLHNRNNQVITQNETIGRLSYLSSYITINDDNGKAIGFINVPFFASEKELNFQISNIVVALINLYAFIFLLSGVLTVFITRWLTRTLSVVINRFERLSLTQNELISWPYEDEIGTLVTEYNKMVRKVEENAVLLAQSERESAWREMARQVAHEITNPLTPMKLNIQYLQQAIKNGYGDIAALALKVSESLIEQIDNLTYIASEFSNFAKMPEAKPEDVELNELLDKAVELFLNEENAKVAFNKWPQKITVHTDKSQLLRVFTNLIGNAVQAIPTGRQGIVTVTLKTEEQSALISFTDNGVGIPADTIEKIFQPYFTTKSSGTGLGLAMTKKIIEFWGGTIWFDTKEDVGTSFYIRLPLAVKE